MINKGKIMCGLIVATNLLTEGFRPDSDLVYAYIKRSGKSLCNIPTSTLQRMMLKSNDLISLYVAISETIKEEFERRDEINSDSLNSLEQEDKQ